MAEPLARRSALGGVLQAGDFGTVSPHGPGIRLSECRGLALIAIAAEAPAYALASSRLAEAFGLALPREANRAETCGALAALWSGPGRALLAGPEAELSQARVATALGDVEAALTDLSHARTVLRLGGNHVRELLAKGCGLDFHPRAFGAGQVALSAYAHIAVLLHARDARPTVDLYAPRSLAQALWAHLLEGALEFGCRVGG